MRALRTLALVALGGLALAPARAEAESAARGVRARAHADEGQEAFRAGRYEDAIREFRAAYDLVPEPMLSYNIAVCHERLGRPEDAIQHYQRYLREEPDGRNAEEARRRVERLHRQRAAAQDAPLEVAAVDEESTLERLDRTVPRSPLETARHDLGLVLGMDACLTGSTPCSMDAPLDLGFSLLLDYHYRLSPRWQLGGGLVYDYFGRAGAYHESRYGLVAGARYAFRFVEVLELRVFAQLGYEYVDTSERARGYESYHWVFFRFGPSLAWDLYRGFGLRLDLAARLGYVAYEEVPDDFGAGLDLHFGIFWAI